MKPDELALKKDELYLVIEKYHYGWFKGSSLNSLKTGVFPGNYVLRVQEKKNRKKDLGSADLIDFTSDIMDVFGANSSTPVQGNINFKSVTKFSVKQICNFSHLQKVVKRPPNVKPKEINLNPFPFRTKRSPNWRKQKRPKMSKLKVNFPWNWLSQNFL